MGLKVTIPKITVSAEAHQKIQHWVDICPVEISGLGLVEEVEGGYLVSDVFLLKQECTGADTELDPVAIAQLQMELMMKQDGLQDKLLFWWHSHVNMGVFWSSTDETCIRTCLGDRYLISIVYNKKGQYKARIDYGNNHTRITIDDMEMHVEDAVTEDDAFDIMYDALCEKQGDKEFSHYDSMRQFFDLLKEEGMLNEEAFDGLDLGFYDFCKKEYQEKVTQKHHRVGLLPGKAPGAVSASGADRWKREKPSQRDMFLYGDNYFEDYSDDRVYDGAFKGSVQPDENIADVYDMMTQSWKQENYFD